MITLESILIKHFCPTAKELMDNKGNLTPQGNECYNEMTDILFELGHYFKSLGEAQEFLKELTIIGISKDKDFIDIVTECDSILEEEPTEEEGNL